ncbi:hypothetical protein GCM10010166_61590 [Couchioplanes caeruleus subsp. azureus]|nr:hypothetical protein GCM10010166_61590 [Couchioplanes caeruleus subsp. azureus]
MPVEHGRWLVTLAGTRGAQPPTDETGFVAYARHTVSSGGQAPISCGWDAMRSQLRNTKRWTDFRPTHNAG